MAVVLTLNKIAACGTELFGEAYTVTDQAENPDAIVLRSASMHEMELPDALLSVARAGAGVNNIPIDKCTGKGIVVFNTPGANANGVKELVLAGLLLSSRKIIDGVEWAKTLKGTEGIGKAVEKGKSAFAGSEIAGKKLAVIGLGAIGQLVANAAYGLGMEVIGYDPYLSVKAALGLDRHVKIASEMSDALANADYATVHVPLLDSTRGMIGKDAFAGCKKGLKLMNFSRDGLVDEEALKAAIADGTVDSYVTDFPDANVLEMDHVIAIPHLGASTAESEDNCAVMACRQTIDYLENGNIVNSVNFPAVQMARGEGERITVIHQNIPNMLGQISSACAANGVNIDNMMSKNRNEVAYTVLDLSVGADASDLLGAIQSIEGVIRTRAIK